MNTIQNSNQFRIRYQLSSEAFQQAQLQSSENSLQYVEPHRDRLQLSESARGILAGGGATTNYAETLQNVSFRQACGGTSIPNFMRGLRPRVTSSSSRASSLPRHFPAALALVVGAY